MNKRLIINKNDIKPSNEHMKVLGVFNPAIIQKDNETIMIARVAEVVKKYEDKYFVVPTYKNNKISYIKIDRHDSDFDFSDARVIRNHKQNYLTSISHFRVARSEDGVHFLFTNTRIFPETEYEVYGIEDPRITQIGDDYFITYSAISDHGINVALMKTTDFYHFERLGIIFPFDNKDCVIFPHKINDLFYAFHRPSKSDFGHLDMWTSESRDLLHWGNHRVMVNARPSYQLSSRIGAGAVPFMTDKGWVVIYHAADANHQYHLAAMLLDADNPNRILMRSKKPLLEPEEEFEKNGFFNNVVFTCGLTRKDDYVTIYYGVCDENIALCQISITEIFANMEEVTYARI